MATAQPPAARVGGRRLSALVAAAFALAGALSLAVDDVSGAECEAASVTAPVLADTWLDENSPASAKGSDSVLSVDAGSLNVDTAEVSGRARLMLRFAMPAAVPAGCVVESARLFVFSSEETAGTRVEAIRLAGAWTESGASWSNQPATVGPAATIWSREGYMRWNVTSQVEAMLGGSNHGFLIRDAKEGAEVGGGGHGFYSREKGDITTLPYLEIRFAAPGSDEPPGPPQPPVATAVSCGQVLTRSTLVTNDLSGCLGDGLIIDASNIIVDLGGHTIDGTGLGAGIVNDGNASVTVQNGTLQEFDYGVRLYPETIDNVITGLTLRTNQVAAVELFDVSGTHVIGNILDGNGGGIDLVSGTRDSLVTDNVITANGKAGLFLSDATGNRLERNSVGGGGDLGIGLERSGHNVLIGNTSANNSDGGIEIRAGSHGNHVEGNVVTASGDHGILVDMSNGTVLIGNVAHFMSDSGITLNDANDGVVRGNDVRFNTGGLQMDASSRNLVEANDASEISGIGIELGGGSLENVVDGNTVNANGAQGIYVSDDATDPLGVPIPGLGNLIVRNTAVANLSDGIVAAKGGHTLTANVTRDNHGWGILAALVGTIDGGGNVAIGNDKPEQCQGVECREEWESPETTITDKPPDATRSTAATFRFTGSDDTTPVGALRFACSLDGAAYVSCTSPRSLAGLAHGSHTHAVRATDRAGNVDPSPATHTWVIDAIAPETTLGDRPTNPSNAALATFTFSGSDEGGGGSAVSFECRLDAGAFAACTSGHTTDALADGPHAFEVRAVDGAGNIDDSPASHTWTIDTVAPQTTISGPADPTNSTAASLSFEATEAATFECRLDSDDPAAFAGCQSPAEYTLIDGSHTFEVRATDAAGNVESPAAGHTWTIDTVAPQTTISGPADPTTSTAASLSFEATEAATFECRLDSDDPAAFAECESPADYTLTGGSHTFEVRATDAAGNVELEPASHTWTIDTVAPDTTLDARPADPTNSTGATFRFSGSEPGSFACALDEATYAACASPTGYADLDPGGHAFRVRAVDRAGNMDASPVLYTWTVDTMPPGTTLGARPANPTKATTADFSFAGSDDNTAVAELAFACSLDEAAFATCSSPASYDTLAEGAHTFAVAATDAAGNTDGSPATHAWTIDTTPPQTTIDAAPAATSNDATPGFAFSADEDGSSFACSLDGVASTACASPYTSAALADGAHSFAVVATDAAGNTDGSPATHAWTIDTVAPQTTISEAPSDPTKDKVARFVFDADERATFTCRLDDAPAAACEPPYTSSTLDDGPHTFEVKASDAAGNAEEPPVVYSWTVDTVAPTSTISEAPRDPTNATTARFVFAADEGASFACRLDEQPAATCESPYTTPTLAAGQHTFEVRATDLAGNPEEPPVAYAWTVDLVAPQSIISEGPPDPTDATDARFVFTASEDGSSFACSLDEAAFATCSSPASYDTLAEGAHTFAVAATDAAGNTDGSPATHAWTIDTTPPQTTIDAAPAATSNDATPGFAFSADEDGSSFACSLDGVASTACASPYTSAALADGAHSFAVVATDAAGNTDGSPATHAWTIDTVAPQTTITAGPSGATNDNTPSFEFGSEAGASVVCRLHGVEYAACDSPYEVLAPLADGAYSFEVRASDAAGNQGPVASAGFTVDTVAPEVSDLSGPDNPTTGTSAQFRFSADDAEASFQCTLDTGDYGPCASGITYEGPLAPGEHLFLVKATDAALNEGAPDSYTWTIEASDPTPGDTTEPETTINEGPRDPTNATSASFSFSATDDTTAPGALAFACRLDSAEESAWAGCSSPWTYPGLSPGPHTFEVRASDAAGNADSSPAGHSWTIDTTAPDTTIDSGPSAQVQSTSASFTFSGTDNLTASSVLTFTCALDDASLGPCAPPVEYSGLAAGTHTFRVAASDRAGNTDPEAAVHSWTIDTAAPDTTLGDRPANPTNQTSATFSFTGTDNLSDPAALTFQCRVDAAAFATCTSPRTYTGLSAGSHSFEVRATDAVGNTDASPASHNWTIDTSPPNTTITGGPSQSSTTTSTSASFTFTSTENGSTFQCSLDSTSAYAACSSPRAYSGLSVGQHSFRVRAIDPAGNVDPSVASRSWTVQSDTSAPNTTITGGPAAASTTTSTSAEFTFTSNESGSTFQCSLDSTSAYAACSSPKAYTGLSVGSHTFRVRAIDPAGNVDPSPASRAWTIEDSSGCRAVTVVATADAWIEQNSSSSNKGSDSILKVKSQGPTDNFRALVSFALPAAPAGCAFESATLRLYSPSSAPGRTLEARSLAASWTENGVTWTNQPATTETAAATAASGPGYRVWDVTTHMRAMYDDAPNNGFLIRDAAESGSGFEQQFHSREKGESPPVLVVHFVSTLASGTSQAPI